MDNFQIPLQIIGRYKHLTSSRKEVTNIRPQFFSRFEIVDRMYCITLTNETTCKPFPLDDSLLQFEKIPNGFYLMQGKVRLPFLLSDCQTLLQPIIKQFQLDTTCN